MESTRDAVEYIKGVGIFIIAWHHLISNNFPEKFSYFGNQFVVFFFIVSGYGISMSLSKPVEKGCAFDAGEFYKKRFVRIMPLYWLWLAVAIFFTEYPLAWRDIFFIRMYDPPVWFLNAIAHCYVLSPVIYLVVKKLGLWSLLVFCLLLYAVNISFRVMGYPDTLIYAYRKIYLFHVFLFALGMLLPRMLSIKMKLKCPCSLVAAFLVAFLISALQTSNGRIEMLDLTYIKLPYFHINKYNIIFALSALAITYVMLQARPRLFGSQVFILLGKYSLSIYLFHSYYVNGIVALMGKEQHIAVYFLIFAALFPALVGACILCQNGMDALCAGVGGLGTRLFGHKGVTERHEQGDPGPARAPAG